MTTQTTQVDLREAVTGVARGTTGKKRRAKIIAADTWGSTAFYPAEVLERDGGRVFTAGLQMFENHLTDDEEYIRPEGKVENLIGKLVTDAIYESEGEDGPGLYADVEFYDSYLPRINEIADDIGLSVRASGLTEYGERAGREGPVLVALLAAKSVDVVTRAGAGGKLTSILESEGEPAGRPINHTEGTQSMTDVTKEDFDAFSASIKESLSGLVDSLKEALAPAAETDEEKQAREDAEAEALANKPADDEKPEIDHVAVVEALRTNNLPTASTAPIIAALTEGKTLDEAVKAQVALREAFTAAPEETGIVTKLNESASAKSGLAYAVSTLNG